MDQQISIVSQGFIAVICGFLVEALKKAGLPTKYAMLASAGIGLVLGMMMLFLIPDMDGATAVFGGLLAGVAASGVYSGTKAASKIEE